MADMTLQTAAETEQAGSLATWHDFVALLKPRVMTLVVFSAVAGLMAAPGSLHPVLAACEV